MSTIQQQKKKQLTFEEICPKWSYYYRKLLSIPGVTVSGTMMGEQQLEIKEELISLKLDITSCTTCLVGEAHGFSDKYYKNCNQCRQFAMEDVFQYKQSYLDKFVEHWNEVHLNK